jgi:glycosyltransferase involved in cell wall biosynthesis
LHYVATVYNGIHLEQYQTGNGSGNYLAWIGRITPKKGVIEAIRVAQAVGLPLKIAAVVDPVDQQFFDAQVKPLVGGPIEMIGELTPEGRSAFYGNAFATLVPIKWSEPFGLVMTESMACGTPVVALKRGSVPEIVQSDSVGLVVDGEAGILPEKIDDMGVKNMTVAVQRLLGLPSNEYVAMRQAARQLVEDQFTVEKMVQGYEEVYKRVLEVRS